MLSVWTEALVVDAGHSVVKRPSHPTWEVWHWMRADGRGSVGSGVSCDVGGFHIVCYYAKQIPRNMRVRLLSQFRYSVAASNGASKRLPLFLHRSQGGMQTAACRNTMLKIQVDLLTVMGGASRFHRLRDSCVAHWENLLTCPPKIGASCRPSSPWLDAGTPDSPWRI